MLFGPNDKGCIRCAASCRRQACISVDRGRGQRRLTCRLAEVELMMVIERPPSCSQVEH